MRYTLVVGFGRTGRAVARVLAAMEQPVRVVDARSAAQLAVDPAAWPGVDLRLGEPGDERLDDVDRVIPSPGVPRTAPVLVAAVRRGIGVESEIEVACQLLGCPLVAITGTNGKSTTTTLVGLALTRSGRRTFTGGNLGTPLIDALVARPDVAVAEVSSFQLEWVARFHPEVGCLLNVTEDHLDRHGSFASYRAAKERLFAAQGPADFAVVNCDDPGAWSVSARLRARVVPFGWTPHGCGVHAEDGAVCFRPPGGDEERYGLGATRLIGRHNVENVMAAVAVARLAGASPAAVQEAIDTVDPLPHRLALVAERRGVRWFDDSKATNVGAAVKSLASFAGRVVLLAGGVDKGGDYAPLARAAAGKVSPALVFGAAREPIAAALSAAGVPVERVVGLDEAVQAAAAAARPGDTVLLAPACSSFDMFTDYAARGRAFRAAVEALG
jgi:UDP-N-acetylmuramoylalanine--D-glutamate ligase